MAEKIQQQTHSTGHAIGVLRHVAEMTGKHSDYAALDLSLSHCCEGDLGLKDVCKAMLFEHSATLQPHDWVLAAIAAYDKKMSG